MPELENIQSNVVAGSLHLNDELIMKNGTIGFLPCFVKIRITCIPALRRKTGINKYDSHKIKQK